MEFPQFRKLPGEDENQFYFFISQFEVVQVRHSQALTSVQYKTISSRESDHILKWQESNQQDFALAFSTSSIYIESFVESLEKPKKKNGKKAEKEIDPLAGVKTDAALGD